MSTGLHVMYISVEYIIIRAYFKLLRRDYRRVSYQLYELSVCLVTIIYEQSRSTVMREQNFGGIRVRYN